MLKTFEFANPHGRLGMLILEPGKPPSYYWSGRSDCPDPVRKILTEGLDDPETGEHMGGDQGEKFMEILQVEYGRGRFLAGRRGRDLAALPPGARKLVYTPGVSAWWKR